MKRHRNVGSFVTDVASEKVAGDVIDCATLSAYGISRLTVNHLQRILRSKGLETSGLMPVLKIRLLEHLLTVEGATEERKKDLSAQIAFQKSQIKQPKSK